MGTSCRENLDTGAQDQSERQKKAMATDLIPPAGEAPPPASCPRRRESRKLGGDHSRIHGILRAKPENNG